MNEPADEVRRPSLPGYVVLDLLGCGATGAVWSVRSTDGIRLAAKVLADDADQLDYELSVLQSLRHDHVVRLHDVVPDDAADPPGTAMVMELAEGGSLADALECREVLTPGELVTVLSPVARALHDLHGLGLVHGDLSPGNILLTRDGKPLIADLGMSRLAGHAGEEVWATETWAAPEVLAGESPAPASDVYSLGAIAWRALTGRAPEPAALRPDLAELAPCLSPELRDLVNASLAHTESARPLPGEFAIALWQCAKPEPAPVQGSPARRSAALAPGGEADALTRRIRAQAAADDAAAVESTGQPQGQRFSKRMRWLVGAAVVAGVVIAFAATGFGSRGSSGEARAAVPRPPASASGQSTGAPSPTTATPSQTTSAAPSRTPEAATAAKALGAEPVRVLQGLAAARAAAWTRGDQDGLRAAELAGSPAYRRDSADLRTAARKEVRYAGLKFTVRSATVQQGSGDVVQIAASIDRSAYTVSTPNGKRRIPAAERQHTKLSVQWTDDGWRVVDWAAGG